MIIGHCTIEVTKFYAAVKIQAVIRGKLWVYCMLWVLADAPAAVLAAELKEYVVTLKQEICGLEDITSELVMLYQQDPCKIYITTSWKLQLTQEVAQHFQDNIADIEAEAELADESIDEYLVNLAAQHEHEHGVEYSVDTEPIDSFPHSGQLIHLIETERAEYDNDLEFVSCVIEATTEVPAAEVPATVPAAASHIMQYEALDIWVQTTFGEDYDWEFLCMMSPANQQSAHELFPTFRVLEDDGSTLNVGIAIIEREFESLEEEEEFEDEKACIKDEENLLAFVSVYSGNGTVIEISGQRGTYYMTYGGGPEGGYFHYTIRAPEGGHFYFNYKIRRDWGTAFDLNTRVGRVELVDDPDMPDGHEVKAVKVWPAAVPAEVLAAQDPAVEVPQPSQIAIDAAAQNGGDPLDLCDICGIDRGHHDLHETEDGQTYLLPCEQHLIPVAEDPAVEVPDEADDPQYQEPCWNCPAILHINMPINCIKCISTGEEHTVCGECWHDVFEDDDDWVDMDASSEENSDAE
jgi:hypothetical protein